MKANVGNADRILRILAGIAILAVALFIEGPARWAGLVGFVPLLTGIFGYCPLYAAFGFDTCPVARKPS